MSSKLSSRIQQQQKVTPYKDELKLKTPKWAIYFAMSWQRGHKPTCEASLFSAITSDCFAELVGVVVMEEVITEVEEGEDETGGEVVRLLRDKALTNLSPRDPRSCMDGGSSLKNKLL